MGYKFLYQFVGSIQDAGSNIQDESCKLHGCFRLRDRGVPRSKETTPPLEPRKGPRHRPTLKSWEEALSYERGTPVEVPGSRKGVPSFKLDVPVQGHLAHKNKTHTRTIQAMVKYVCCKFRGDKSD